MLRTPTPVHRASTPTRRSTTPVRTASTPTQGSTTPVRRFSTPTQRSTTPVRQNSTPARRASLPVESSTAYQPPTTRTAAILHHVKSPDVSVNSPIMDCMAEFDIPSYEEVPLLSSKARTQLSFSGSGSDSCLNDCSITKDRCTVQVLKET